jgi:cell division protein FtsW
MNNSSSSNSAPINRKKGHIDWFILLPIVALMSFSVAFVYSANSPIATIKFNDPEKLFFKHAIMVLLGFVNIIVFARIDYHKLRKFSKSLLFISIILLTVVLFFGF